MSDINTVATLSFASKPDMWAIAAPTGDYSADCEAGVGAAIELQDFMRTQDAPFMLGHVLQAMIAKGRWSGVEVGFAQAMAQAAVS